MPTALVTGASQGVGAGVVEGLAEHGFRVYFTGRDRRRLEQTAQRAQELGGMMFPRAVDHSDDRQVEELFREIGQKHHLHLLVNCAWGGYERMIEDGRFTWADPFWRQPMWRWESTMVAGVRAAFVASQLATRRMLDQERGLIVNLSYWSAQKHIGNVLYGMAKAATDKMTADMDAELRPREVFVLSMYPGLVRTERVMENAEYLDLSNSESPRFIGRTIAAIWLHNQYARENRGCVCIAAQAARELGVTDVDGSTPNPMTLENA